MRMKISNAGERDVAFKLGDVQSGYCFSHDGVICVKSNHFRYGCDAKVKEYACLNCEDGHLMWISELANVRVVGAELHVGLYEKEITMGDNAFTERIKIKYHADITKIEKIAVGDWIDLRCAEDVVMHEGELKMFSLGISMQLPTGFEAIVAPRSSTAKNYGIILANSIGIIDESYCGNDDVWRFIAYAFRDAHIPFDARVAQFRIMKHQNPLEFIEVEELQNANRGGIGSTGRI